MSRGFKIRKGTRTDSKQLVKLLLTFVEFEHKKPLDPESRVRFIDDIFDRKLAHLFVATSKEKLIGYALYFYTYASFQAKPVLYLEDIFVLEDYRRLGVGFALFKKCAEEALKHHCSRMEWAVLTWNKTAMNFYEKLGAKKENLFIYRIGSVSLMDLKNRDEATAEEIGDPVSAMGGLLKHVSESSIKLQHEASKIRARKLHGKSPN